MHSLWCLLNFEQCVFVFMVIFARSYSFRKKNIVTIKVMLLISTKG